MRPAISYKPCYLVLAAALCTVGMWTYVSRVLIPYQKADAVAHDRPRGNLSDLYPRWVGAKELLLHGRNPYSPEISREIQAGYYGRALDSSRPNDPRDQQSFAYPVYVAFWLAPTIGLPFAVVQKGFFWILLVLTSASVLLWFRVLRWSAPLWVRLCLVVLTLGSVPVMQGLKLQQMSLLVAGLLVIALTLLVADHPVAAGILLALATIKPQLLLVLLSWLGIWTVADWRRRYRLGTSFLATMAILIATAEWYLPHWIPQFWHAVREYQRYTGTISVSALLIGGVWGRLLELLAGAAFLSVCWRERRQATTSDGFAFMLSLSLAITLVIAPTYGSYNQVLLIPAALLLVKDRQRIWQHSLASRVLLTIATFLVFWPWLLSLALAAFSFFLPPETVEQAWVFPLWTMPQIPVAMAALMLAYYYQAYAKRSFAAPVGPGSS